MARETFKKLKRDGAYSGDHGLICGYSGLAAPRKEQFLRDAATTLRQVGKRLSRHSLTEMEIRRNPAGVAVSGEVTAEYWRPDNPCRRVWVEIGTTCLASLSGRRDGISILARTQEYRGPAKPGQRQKKGRSPLVRCTPGPNQWLSPEFNSHEIADALLRIYNIELHTQNVAAHTATGGILPIPSPVIGNEDEAITWKKGHQAVEWAFRADRQEIL